MENEDSDIELIYAIDTNSDIILENENILEDSIILVYIADVLLRRTRGVKRRKTNTRKLKYSPSKYTKTCEVSECTICLVDFKKSVSVFKLECDHVFHKMCLQKWVKVSPDCPICRILIC